MANAWRAGTLTEQGLDLQGIVPVAFSGEAGGGAVAFGELVERVGELPEDMQVRALRLCVLVLVAPRSWYLSC